MNRDTQTALLGAPLTLLSLYSGAGMKERDTSLAHICARRVLELRTHIIDENI